MIRVYQDYISNKFPNKINPNKNNINMKYLSLLITSTILLCLQSFNLLQAQTFDWTKERFNLTVRLNDGSIKEDYTVPAPRR